MNKTQTKCEACKRLYSWLFAYGFAAHSSGIKTLSADKFKPIHTVLYAATEFPPFIHIMSHLENILGNKTLQEK